MAPYTKYSEQELVTLLVQQNEVAFGYLYENYSPALFGIINQIVPNKDLATDILQDVFVNIWRKISSYDPAKGRLFTWMLNIARNAAIDKIRSRPYQDSLKNQPLGENVSINTPNSTVHAQVNDVGLKKLINKLKDDYRVVIELSYFQGFTHEEIAKLLNIPLGTVKTRIRSALIQLRTLI
ncbi:MAG TPA: sigma-70 family RNA polymerase sigma factor [Chitinophagaceae bacterium]|nr:sigma-70 family RNA polymerase sigma factor [Chitinophagaceae bacterium]